MDVRAISMYRLFLRDSDTRLMLVSPNDGSRYGALPDFEAVELEAMLATSADRYDAMILPLSETGGHQGPLTSNLGASLGMIFRGARSHLRQGGRLIGAIDHSRFGPAHRLTARGPRRLTRDRPFCLDPARRIRSALEDAGYVRVQVYFVDPHASRPRVLIPDERVSARAHFTNALIDSRSAYSWLGYRVRLHLASFGLYALLCKSVLFVADTP